MTVEIEHVNCEILSSLEARGLRVQPSPRTISVIQDKYAQKEHFKEVMYGCVCLKGKGVEVAGRLGGKSRRCFLHGMENR